MATNSAKRETAATSSQVDDDASSAKTPDKGGLYALAGFIYQLFSSIAESIQVCRMGNRPDVDELMTLETFGQDAYVAHVPDGGNGKLIQYKHTSTGQLIQPAELRDILGAFVKSCTAMGLTTDQIDSELATNREASEWTAEWMAVQSDDKELRKKIWRGTEDPRDETSDRIFRVARKLDWKPYDESDFREKIRSRACEFGVLPDEMRIRVRDVLALFLERAGTPRMRQIHQSELNEALAGYPGAIPFRGDAARKLQMESITRGVARRKVFMIPQKLFSVSRTIKWSLCLRDGRHEP